MRIGLDIDHVVCDTNKIIYNYNPNWDGETWECGIDWHEVPNEEYLSLPVLEIPSFKPTVYISNRVCESWVTRKWLDMYNFPSASIVHTARKLDVCLDFNLDYFIDDNYHNFYDLTDGGVKCVLRTQPWNKMIKTDYRISTLRDFSNLFSDLK